MILVPHAFIIHQKPGISPGGQVIKAKEERHPSRKPSSFLQEAADFTSTSSSTTDSALWTHLNEDVFILDDQRADVNGTSKGPTAGGLGTLLDPAGEVVSI